MSITPNRIDEAVAAAREILTWLDPSQEQERLVCEAVIELAALVFDMEAASRGR